MQSKEKASSKWRLFLCLYSIRYSLKQQAQHHHDRTPNVVVVQERYSLTLKEIEIENG
jgi:hypothetical protein